VTTLSYVDGLEIGPARNYQSTNRSCAKIVTDSFLYIADDAVDYYKINITDASDGQQDYEYTVLRADDKIYLQPLPSNINANIHIEPYSTAYNTNNPFEITNHQLLSQLSTAEGTGFIDQHDFQLQSSGVSESYVFSSFDDTEPSHQYEGNLGEQINVVLDDSSDVNNNIKKETPGFNIILLLISMIVFVGYKSKKNKKIQ
jgi:hypothetical protein